MKIVPLVRKAKRITKKVITTPKRVKRSLTNPRQRYAYYYKYAKVHPNRMLFDSFSGRGISDSPYAVLQEMMSQGITSDYEIFFTSRDVERDQAFVDANNLPIKLVDFFSLEYPKILATAKYLLSNSSFPQYFIRRPEQVFVETWHGTPLKTLGKQIKNGMQSMYFAQHSFIQASVLTHPNDFTRDAMMRDYNLENIFTGERRPLSFLKDKYVACMSGIARPESFEGLVEGLGAHVEIRRRYPDHYWFDQKDLETFVERCADRAMDMIVTTEKDAVRFLKPGEMEVPIYFLRIQIDIEQGQEHWDKMIDRICALSDPQPQPQWSDSL
jgi:hypothetical protein